LVVDFAPSGKLSLTLKEEILLKFFSFAQYFVFQFANPLLVEEATIASNAEKLATARFFFHLVRKKTLFYIPFKKLRIKNKNIKVRLT